MSMPLHIFDPDDGADASGEFVSLLMEHQRSLLAFIVGLAPSHGDAEEILQRTNVVLWKKRSSFEIGTSFRAWAFSVARWETRAFISERGRRSWLIYDDEVARLLSERLCTIPEPELNERAVALRSCLAKLGKEHRDLIAARYEEGLSFKECAERFTRSEGGLRVTLHRLKTALRRCVVERLRRSP